ncbi:MAG: hypothetical protein PHQ11_08060 [Paludibacter sp.]|nr:hypothetical protein [Paludibacter sp.]MDD4198580.1 hypothetical protein [Paludibacter sp.]MDD4427710.1 hypothetical protein [Paludibacter sp.]
MKKFRNKYRIQSHRMPEWDYANNGIYFITLVTQNRECYMGQINENSEIIYSDFGNIIYDEWVKSFEVRDELFLDEFIIMPNHLHAIVVLDRNWINKPNGDLHDLHKMDKMDKMHKMHVETHGRASLQSPLQSPLQFPLQSPLQSIVQSEKQQFVRKPTSISSFIAGFKSAINSKIDDYIDENKLKIPKYNRNNHFFQSNYHDHIIRNDNEYVRIKEYIINNPIKWHDDTFNPVNQNPGF